MEKEVRVFFLENEGMSETEEKRKTKERKKYYFNER